MNFNLPNQTLKCDICNQTYASLSSLFRHKKKFHKNNNNNESNIIRDECTNVAVGHTHKNEPFNIMIHKNEKISLKCEYCNKYFTSMQSKYEHKIKRCKYNPNNSFNANKLDILERKNLELEKSLKALREIKELKKMNELQDLRDFKALVELKELQKLRKMIKLEQYNIKLNNNTVNKINRLSNNLIISSNDSIFSKNICTFNNDPIKFFHYNNQIFFKANDITKILDYDNTKYAVTMNVNITDIFRICDISENLLHNYPTSISCLDEEDINNIFINEFGLYSLISASKLKKQEIQNFKQWIVLEVMPAIRNNESKNIINSYIEEDLDKYYKKREQPKHEWIILQERH